MVDRLNERLKTLCGGNNPGGAFPNAFHVDLRNTVSSIGLWADELHPTDKGFALVSAKFETVLKTAAGVASVEAAAVERPTPNTGDDADVEARRARRRVGGKSVGGVAPMACGQIVASTAKTDRCALPWTQER